MPVFDAAATPPSWCELRHVETLRSGAGSPLTSVEPTFEQVAVVVGGEGEAVVGDVATAFQHGSAVRARAGERLTLTSTTALEVVRLVGRWGDDIGGAGLFTVAEVPDAELDPFLGDPVDYPKRTRFDKHFHDCDEYWILLEGRGTVLTDGSLQQAGAGECVATGAGFHHDVPLVTEPITAVFFETTMCGLCRRGHLWEHAHGPARPDPTRV